MRRECLEDCLPLRGRWLRYSLIPLGLAVYAAYGWCVVTGQFQVRGHHHRGSTFAVRTQINAFKMALQLYALDHGRIPTMHQGLEVLVKPPRNASQPSKWKGPYLKDVTVIPLDPWGNPYHYRIVKGADAGYLVVSFGADGLPGGSGDAADVLSDPWFEGEY